MQRDSDDDIRGLRGSFDSEEAQDDSGLRLEEEARIGLFGAGDGRRRVHEPGGAPIDAVHEIGRGTVVGRYLVLGRIGEGGMGVVYESYDPELDRKVALKLISPQKTRNMEDARVRLLREALALARLSHPNIVTIYDVGTYREQVWLAMEFVAGETLGAWARQSPRSWSELLRVLIDVARGVASAHAEGLVHRDLKPDNVMIGREGRVRVMDFGLAHGRAVTITHSESAGYRGGDRRSYSGDQGDPPSSDTTVLALRLTETGSIQGSPPYMAPEQWLGRETGAWTDQFGWSVMAWELLYGERPFAGHSLDAIATAVTAGRRRPPPRGRGIPNWVRHTLERGLSPDPSKRWPTMAALLSALDRGRMRSRMARLVVALAAVAALAGSLESARRWSIAQDEAAAQRAFDQHVDACRQEGAVIDAVWNDAARQAVLDAFAATRLGYAAGTATRVLPWLDRQAREWRDARVTACMNTNVHGAWDEELSARASWCLEDRLISYESIVQELQRAGATTVRKAVQAVSGMRSVASCLDEQRLRLQPRPPADRQEAVREVRREVVQANTLQIAGNLKEALAVATSARERAEREVGWQPLVAAARGREASVLEKSSRYEDAETAAREAYFEAANASDWETAAGVATNLISIVGYNQSRHAEGVVWGRHAAVNLAQTADHGGVGEATRLNNLANVHRRSGELVRAVELHEKALSIRSEMLGTRHPAVAASLSNLAAVRSDMGAYDEAIALLSRARDIYIEALGADHPDVALVLNNIAVAYEATANFSGARELMARAVQIYETAFGPEHPDVAMSLINIGVLLNDAGAYKDALAAYERALAIYQKVVPADHPDIAMCYTNMAQTRNALGDYPQALTLAERSLAIKEKALGPEHPNLANSLGNLVTTYLQMKNYASARPLAERALAIVEKSLGPNHPRTAYQLGNLAGVHRGLGKKESARALWERALAIVEGSQEAARPDVALYLHNLAELRMDAGEHSEARGLLERALLVSEKASGGYHPDVAVHLATLARVHALEDHPSLAVPLLERAIGIYVAHDGVQEGEADAHFTMARLLAASGGADARAMVEAERALAGYLATGDAPASSRVRRWILRHDPR